MSYRDTSPSNNNKNLLSPGLISRGKKSIKRHTNDPYGVSPMLNSSPFRNSKKFSFLETEERENKIEKVHLKRQDSLVKSVFKLGTDENFSMVKIMDAQEIRKRKIEELRREKKRKRRAQIIQSSMERKLFQKNSKKPKRKAAVLGLGIPKNNENEAEGECSSGGDSDGFWLHEYERDASKAIRLCMDISLNINFYIHAVRGKKIALQRLLRKVYQNMGMGPFLIE